MTQHSEKNEKTASTEATPDVTERTERPTSNAGCDHSSARRLLSKFTNFFSASTFSRDRSTQSECRPEDSSALLSYMDFALLATMVGKPVAPMPPGLLQHVSTVGLSPQSDHASDGIERKAQSESEKK
ncbi:hypothetical protein IAU60_002064 [Kwoniella sp. DSM 27419]